MTIDEDVGYFQAPRNSNGITRSRTTAQLRAWKLERSIKQLERINEADWGKLEFPSLYIMFDKKKVYIGEGKSAYDRAKSHITNPKAEIKNWGWMLIVNDGRPATQSDSGSRYLGLFLVTPSMMNLLTVYRGSLKSKSPNPKPSLSPKTNKL